MRQRQDGQRHGRHGHTGKAGGHVLLTPGQQHERNGRAERADCNHCAPGAPMRCLNEKPPAQGAPNCEHQQRRKADAARSQPERCDTLERQFGHKERPAPCETQNCDHGPAFAGDVGGLRHLPVPSCFSVCTSRCWSGHIRTSWPRDALMTLKASVSNRVERFETNCHGRFTGSVNISVRPEWRQRHIRG